MHTGNTLKHIRDYGWMFIKWVMISMILGAVGGIVGSLFHIAIDGATHLRQEHGWLILLLPLGGLAISFMYHPFTGKGRLDTNRVLDSVRQDSPIPFIMVPLIFVSTVITHGLGGSAGREGAALQLGGGIGYRFGKLLRVQERDMHIVVMAGMSSVFSALFGTPLTAAVFALEVTTVGVLHYVGLLPCVIASVVAFQIAQLFGIAPVRFSGIVTEVFSVPLMGKVLLLTVLCALVSILFCTSIHQCERYMKKWLKNRYLRTAVGATAIVILTALIGSQDYNGAGMAVIENAIAGTAKPEAFLLKIVFTALTIAAGFKGGEIVPAFFIGATFGCLAGTLLGINPGFAAAIGFVALFCGVVNCPLASLLLATEVFGTSGLLFFAIAVAVSYTMSGSFGLYRSQELVFSKLDDKEVHQHAK